MAALGVVALVCIAAWSLYLFSREKGRADRLQGRVNEQHEQLGKQSELWNDDRDRLRMVRNELRTQLHEHMPESELEKIRATEYGRQVLGL